MPSTIDFRQVRDVGELLNTTLFFARAEFKPLVRALIFIAGPFLLVSAIGSVVFQASYTMPVAGTDDPFAALAIFANPWYYILLLVGITASSTILVVSFAYCFHYVEHGESATVEDVLAKIREDLGIHVTTIVGLMLVTLMLIVIVLVPCLGLLIVIPLGGFLAVMLTILWPARLNEGLSFMSGFERARELSKDFFWPTLGFLALLAVVQIAIAILFAMPAMIAGFGMAFNSLDGGPSEISAGMSIFSALASMIGSLCYALSPIGATAVYFSLVERKEAPGLADRVASLAAEESTSDVEDATGDDPHSQSSRPEQPPPPPWDAPSDGP